ncbi:MAG: hypothetical protein EP343_29070 [Deltaproteobacteria bacterium]|nr:MAG: hypothetical protein EP343_29070 [Deltaproteobacteria bacterium]
MARLAKQQVQQTPGLKPHIPWKWRGSGETLRVVNPRPRKWWRAILRLGLFLTLLGTTIGGCSGLFLVTKYSKGIPVLTSLKQYQPALPSKVYSEGEDQIGEFAAERRYLVPLELIPKKLLYAFVAAEDDRFFAHSGVDPLGIMRAVVKNLKAGRIKAGGSTLTQQVAKSFLVDRMVIRMQKGICRSDKQCDWEERCFARPGSPFGKCQKRSFKTCSKQTTIIYQGKPTQIYRGFSTLCDSHEVCRPKCKDAEQNTSGLCPQWRCEPAASRQICSADRDCHFGQVCTDGTCKSQMKKQVSDMMDRLIRGGAEIHRVKGPSKLLDGLQGNFKRQVSKKIIISARNASQIDSRKLTQLPGIRAIYRFAEKSFRRKIKEAILATRLERQFSKEQILWLYITHVYLGHQSYGVQAAARNYFGKNVWDLTLAEAAVIAGLPKAPSKYDPYRFPKRARKRMKYVLKRMVEMNYISEAERQKALKQKLETKPLPDLLTSKTPYFTSEVRKEIIRKYGKEKLKKGGLKVFTTIDVEKQMVARRKLRKGLVSLDMRQGYRGPLGVIERKDWDKANKKAAEYYGDKPLEPGKVYAGLVTSIDRRGQKARVQVGKHKGWLPLAGMLWAGTPNSYRSYRRPRLSSIGNRIKKGYWILVEVLKSWKQIRTGSRYKDRKIPKDGLLFRLRQYPKVEGALLSMDPHSGYVEALVGGYSFSRSQFNRAFYACRQPGSSFKPLVYTTAFEVGEDKFEDGKKVNKPLTPGTILLDAPLVYDSGDDGKGSRYKPSNYTGRYEGPVTARKALVSSMNIPAIKMMMRVGIDKVRNYARRYGITTPLRKELGLALGQSCVRPWELMQFYAMLTRKGTKANPTMIKMVLDRDGKILEDHRSYDDPTLSPESRLNRLESALFEKEERIISKENAFLITYLLRQVVAGGTGYKVRKLGKPAAGKTGTTNDSFDVWFSGFTPLHTTIAWLGFDKNERPLGSWESGGTTAAPVWLDYMKEATKGLKWSEWKPPSGIVWERIDPKTGKLANVDTPNARRLPFRRGTEPKQKVERRGRVSVDSFYQDQ